MARSTFVYVTYIRTTPERLWSALTDREFMKQWWFGNYAECEPSKLIVAVSGGWPKVLSNLKSVLETGTAAIKDPYPAVATR